MINLLEEEYNATSGKYVLHLTMGANDTVTDLPSSTRPFNSSNYSCSFDYGEPAEGSTAVNEISGKLYTYGDGEWYEPEPAVEKNIPVYPDGYEFKINGGETIDTVTAAKPGDVITAAEGGAFLLNKLYRLIDGVVTFVPGDNYESYTVTENDFLISGFDTP